MTRGLYHLITSRGDYPIMGFDLGNGLCKLQLGTIKHAIGETPYRMTTETGHEMTCLNPGFQSSDTRRLDTVWLERTAS